MSHQEAKEERHASRHRDAHHVATYDKRMSRPRKGEFDAHAKTRYESREGPPRHEFRDADPCMTPDARNERSKTNVWRQSAN